MNGKGGVYIKQLLDNGALKEDFITELVCIYPLEECLSREAELAKTSLFPKGLNGNAGSYIEHTKEVREKMSKSARKNNLKRGENGTHHMLGGEIQRKIARERIEDGTHNFLDREAARKNANKRVENGTHHFLDSEFQSKNARKNNLKRVEEGTHNFQVKGMMTALNIETNEVRRITKELYYSRRDIYFHNTSKVFKEWKFNNL